MFTRHRPSSPGTDTDHGAARLPRHRQAGFTLLEIIMALTLLALLSGMVFGIVRVSIRTAVDTQIMQQENDEVNRYVALCRNMFQNLPVTAILTLTVTESSDPVQQELTISGAPEAFGFGVRPLTYEDTILGVRPDLQATEASETGQRLYFLGLSREDLIPGAVGQSAGTTRPSGSDTATPDDQGRFWMPLLANVISLHWRFYKEDGDVWEEEWSDTEFPQLVEMNLLLKDRTLPLRTVFSLPTTKLTAANPALRPTTSTTSSTSNTQGAGAQAGGGGGQGNRGQQGTEGGRRGGGEQRGGGRGQGEGQGQGRGQGQGQDPAQGQGQGARGAGGGGRTSSGGNSSQGAQPAGGGGSSSGASR